MPQTGGNIVIYYDQYYLRGKFLKKRTQQLWAAHSDRTAAAAAAGEAAAEQAELQVQICANKCRQKEECVQVAVLQVNNARKWRWLNPGHVTEFSLESKHAW